MGRIVWALVGLLCASPALGAPAVGAPAVFDGEGYRAASYRAPVDRDPAPATRIALPAAMALAGDALFIDVLPAAGALRAPHSGRWTLCARCGDGGGVHQTIAGAIWLPEVGRSMPDRVLWQGLLARVAAWRRHHRQGLVVVFCRADCWMSWNAARRLALGGVGNVWWLAEGIEGWQAAGGRLVAAQPLATPEMGKPR